MRIVLDTSAFYRPDSLDRLMRGAAEVVLPVIPGVEHARQLARDAMIAGHLRPGDVLWATNPRDWLAIGVPAARLVHIDHASRP